jgi:Protein of unknown function (DUF1553)/Protein of unknown function (DUF1549)/Concanavalin A-like lectin/glucanases superfamily/Planctomycete cytochrome C
MSSFRFDAFGRALAVTAFCCGLIPFFSARADDAPAARPIEYNRDVRPILAENCFACHGPDSASRKADLRLDRREAAVEAAVIVPGDANGSELIARLVSHESTEIMPPPKTKKSLTAAQIDTLKRWIAAGAEYQPHWSLIAPKRAEPPAVKHAEQVRNPIDRFLLARLEAQGLSFAPEADRRMLARRLSLDLTGLPPEPELVDAFVADAAPDAYEKLVDRMLNSDRWGEHRARYWLDAARFADSHGIHFDNYREIWAYRDWVINAFNKNLPFDRFTIEQLAGDLLPKHTLDQQVASGFNRCNITTSEGGTIPEEYAVLYTRDRTETASQVWLGLTAGCAVCHDHKFDPISQREFYEMAAFFNNTTQNPMDGNAKDTPPTVFVARPEDRDRWDALGKQLADLNAKAAARRQTAQSDFESWLAAASPAALGEAVPAEGLKLLAPLSEGSGGAVGLVTGGAWRMAAIGEKAVWVPGHVAEKALQFRSGVKVQVPEVGDFEKNQPFSFGAWVKFPKNVPNGSILARMDEGKDYQGWDLWTENGRLAVHIVSKWPEDALKVVTRDPFPANDWVHLFATYDGSGKASGVSLYVNGQPQPVEVAVDALKGSIRTKTSWTLAQRSGAGARLNNLMLQDARVYGRTLNAGDVARLARTSRALWLVSKPAAKRNASETAELIAWYLADHDPQFRALSAEIAAAEQSQAELRGRGTIAHIMVEKPEMPGAFILDRGEYDKRRDPVKPDTPDALPPMPADLPRNRLGFAQWLLRPEHPLTARVTVNRFWQEIFGTGIVRTAGDLGVSGELPSHPELLDWLAVDFRESGWDVKRFFRLLVTSAAYRQSAAATPATHEKDPQNRLVSRGPRFRMDAEMVRDYSLASGGLLVKTIGGPSVKPYQPEGVWEAVAMIGSNTRDYRADRGANLYRRSLYTFWKRSAPPASMEIFNAPSREVCTVRRERTNTPLQALVTLNDPQFVEADRHLAELTLKSGSVTETRLEFLAKRLLARPLRDDEAKIVSASLADLSAYYQAHPADAQALVSVGESKPDATLDAPTLAAWTMLANEMFNLDEVLNK